MKDEIINLGDIHEDELEVELWRFMVQRAKERGIEWAVENQWGENQVIISSGLYTVQWQFVGLEPADYKEVPNKETGEMDYEPVGPWSWEYEDPDFEVSCSWCGE